MKITLDFDNNTVISEQGTISVPELAKKKEDIFKVIGIEEINTDDLRADINNLFTELGFDNVRA